MNLLYIATIFLVIVIAFWLVYKYAPEPPKTVLLWIISIALVVWVMQVLGFWNWISGVKV